MLMDLSCSKERLNIHDPLRSRRRDRRVPQGGTDLSGEGGKSKPYKLFVIAPAMVSGCLETGGFNFYG